MSDFTSSTTATILFDGPPDLDFVGLINELKRTFRNIALEFDEIEVDEHLYALFTNDRLTLRVARGQVPVAAEALAASGRPNQVRSSEEEIAGMLHDYTDTLTVSVSDGAGRSVPERLRVSVCYHVVRQVLRSHEASLVHWHHTNTLFTAEEFENPTNAQPTVTPRRPKATGNRVPRPKPLEGTLPGGLGRFSAGYMGVAENHTRLDESFAQVVDPEHAQIHDAETVEDTPRSGWTDILPNIAPSEEKLRRSRLAIFASDLIEIEDVKLDAPKAEPELPEQLTVYVMTLTIMVMMFPAGFAMMIYNILAGENLKMTARAMALTGVGIALNFAGITDQLISLI
ncbi:hypothetical protein [Actibacterium sp. MT2.3-13A]|uniref:hypothetical protein n=1 Tax=Actibacterium sp. MT2.3-13A TaxID=2828332 RepID=UPI001BA802F3|nr:hypothetical protein [Actibacterium sp. MT2.3-13A]